VKRVDRLMKRAKEIGYHYFQQQQIKSNADKLMKQDRKEVFEIWDELEGKDKPVRMALDNDLHFGREVKEIEVIDQAKLRKAISDDIWSDVTTTEERLNPAKETVVITMLKGAFPSDRLKDIILSEEAIDQDKLRLAVEAGMIDKKIIKKCSKIERGNPRIFARVKKDWIDEIDGAIPLMMEEKAKDDNRTSGGT